SQAAAAQECRRWRRRSLPELRAADAGARARRRHQGEAPAQPYYFTRWFCCTHADCSTTLVMAERFKVLTEVGEQQFAECERKQVEAAAIAAAAADVVMQVAREMAQLRGEPEPKAEET